MTPQERNTLCHAGETLEDLQLGGLRILQKRQGFRYGMDSVLLADFVRMDEKARYADFGAGTGILPLLLTGRGKGASCDALELQPEMAEMAGRSMAMNGLSDRIRVHCADVREAETLLGRCSVDAVVCNPPYGERLGDEAQAEELYRSMSSLFTDFKGWQIGVITAHKRFQECIGRYASVLKSLKSGNLDTTFYIYDGSEKEKSRQPRKAAPSKPMQKGGRGRFDGRRFGGDEF